MLERLSGKFVAAQVVFFSVLHGGSAVRVTRTVAEFGGFLAGVVHLTGWISGDEKGFAFLFPDTLREEMKMTPNRDSGIVNRQSNHTVDETVRKLEGMLQAKGVKLFALVDHSGEAEKAGLHMRPTKLLIFGNPKAGTPLMIASPSIAIDLPLKLLVWEDGEGKVWISYNSPAYLQGRHGLPRELVGVIAGVEALAQRRRNELATN